MNRLETDWFKLVADEDVRPLTLTAQPVPGENLIGLVSRVMEKQAFSSLAAGLSLAGIGCTKPSNIASLLRNADQVQNLATLLENYPAPCDRTVLNAGIGHSLMRKTARTVSYGRISPVGVFEISAPVVDFRGKDWR
jgi:hypothetical protein